MKNFKNQILLLPSFVGDILNDQLIIGEEIVCVIGISMIGDCDFGVCFIGVWVKRVGVSVSIPLLNVYLGNDIGFEQLLHENKFSFIFVLDGSMIEFCMVSEKHMSPCSLIEPGESDSMKSGILSFEFLPVETKRQLQSIDNSFELLPHWVNMADTPGFFSNSIVIFYILTFSLRKM